MTLIYIKAGEPVVVNTEKNTYAIFAAQHL
jgi:hypothetical protein